MNKRYSYVLAALTLTLAFAIPAQAQDVAKEDAAASTEKMESHNEMMGEGCQCPCMQEMHEKMMEMHGDAEGHAEGEAHAEGMDSDEGHAEMMAAHKEMMANCQCMSDMAADGEGMSCKMHGEGMQHRHGMESDEAEAEAEAEVEVEG